MYREDLSYSYTHHQPTPPRRDAVKGSKVRWPLAWERFYAGPGYQSFGGPIVFCYLDVREGTKVRLQSKTDWTYAIYQGCGKGFLLLHKNHRPRNPKLILTNDKVEKEFPEPFIVVGIPKP